MAAHGGVGADGDAGVAGLGRLVERLAHAVQALELDLHPGVHRHAAHGRQGVGVVGGELGVQVRRRPDQLARRHQVGKVCGRLGRIDGIVGAASDLGALDLSVPVGALDQAHHQAASRAAGQVGDAADHLGAALLVSLHGEAEPAPLAQVRVVGQPVQQLQRQGEAVGLLGVDGAVEVVFRGDEAEPLHPRRQLLPDAGFLHRLVARRQGRELDGDAVAGFRTLPALGLAHLLDGLGVDALVALGVVVGAGALAQHVEGAEVALLLRPLQRRLDVAAEHELLAHDADGRGHRLPDHRLAEPPGQAAHEAAQVALGVLVNIDQVAGQHQPPGGGVDEQAVGLAEVAGPVGRADLLGDEAVLGVLVRRAQQGLGQAHQRQALAGAQRELLQEALDHALAVGAGPGGADQGLGLGDHLGPLGLAEGAGGEQFAHGLGLVTELPVVERVPHARPHIRCRRHPILQKVRGAS